MHIQAPFGGKKASGIGREFGEYVCLRSHVYDLRVLTFNRRYELSRSQRLF